MAVQGSRDDVDPEIPDLKAWKAAYAAFKECIGSAGLDMGMQVSYSIAWAAAMNAVMAFNREVNSRKQK